MGTEADVRDVIVAQLKEDVDEVKKDLRKVAEAYGALNTKVDILLDRSQRGDGDATGGFRRMTLPPPPLPPPQTDSAPALSMKYNAGFFAGVVVAVTLLVQVFEWLGQIVTTAMKAKGG